MEKTRGKVSWRTAYIGLGANIGSRHENLRAALHLLDGLPGIRVIACSHAYETEPVGMDSSMWFINAVAKIKIAMGPGALLEILLETERVLGRNRQVMDRTVDLDLLYMEGVALEGNWLVVPHPRLHERRFVLAPWSEIAPDLALKPWGKTVSELLDALEPGDAEVRETDIILWERSS